MKPAECEHDWSWSSPILDVDCNVRGHTPVCSKCQMSTIQVMDAITEKVLAHKPKPKSRPARKRARRAKKIAQAADV